MSDKYIYFLVEDIGGRGHWVRLVTE